MSAPDPGVADLPIAMSMGDPLGIGPEICVKAALARPTARRLFVVGDVGVMRSAAARLGAPLEIAPIARPEEVAALRADQLGALQAGPLLDAGTEAPLAGEAFLAAAAGAAAHAAIQRAVDFALERRVAAIVTAPIHKAHLAAAGVKHPGHTEILAERAGCRVAMMLANPVLRVVLVSIHVSLADAVRAVTPAAELEAIRLARLGGRALGFPAPRVAVAGLNPHAGEEGLFGREEIEIIAPAVAAARAEGIDASGPWPGDTVFMQAREGRFDVVVAQYHDQGLIPIKYLGLAEGVNVTLGLPFARTSPDHGTALDIAGKGIADPASMIEAAKLAERLWENASA